MSMVRYHEYLQLLNPQMNRVCTGSSMFAGGVHAYISRQPSTRMLYVWVPYSFQFLDTTTQYSMLQFLWANMILGDLVNVRIVAICILHFC